MPRHCRPSPPGQSPAYTYLEQPLRLWRTCGSSYPGSIYPLRSEFVSCPSPGGGPTVVLCHPLCTSSPASLYSPKTALPFWTLVKRERPESNPRGRSGFVLVYQNVCATVFAALDVILSTIRVTLTLQRPNFGLLPKREAGIEPARSIPVCPNACVTVLPP